MASRPKKVRFLQRRVDFLAKFIADEKKESLRPVREELAALQDAVAICEARLAGRTSTVPVVDLRMLQRRAEYLETLIADASEDMSWEREELSALRWAMDECRAHAEAEARHLEMLKNG